METRRLILRFPADLTGQPIVYRLAKDWGLEFNILKASINPEKEGLMLIEIKGEEPSIMEGIGYLSKKGVIIEPFGQKVLFKQERCIHCGLCVGLCPSSAFSMDPTTYHVSFQKELCLACGLCFKACPVKAMEVTF